MSQDLAEFFPVDAFGVIITHQALAGGLSGALVEQVTTSRGEYVLRVQHGEDANWEGSLAIHRLAASKGIAPPLLHVDVARRATVSQRIAAMPIAAALENPAARQAVFGALISQLVTLRAFPTQGLVGIDALGLTRQVWAEQSARPGFPAWAAALATRLDDIDDRLAHDKRQALAHGDLNPANILWDGTRVWLVDWDRTGLSHPYLDLACLANFLSLSDEVALGMLAQQEGTDIDGEQCQVFKSLRDLARIAYGCAFLRLVPALDTLTIPSLDATPTLPECFARMHAGELSMTGGEGQALLGAALLKQAMD